MIDRQTAKALDLLDEASVAIRREIDLLVMLLDQQQAVISALHDRAIAECPLALVPEIEDAAEREASGIF